MVKSLDEEFEESNPLRINFNVVGETREMFLKLKKKYNLKYKMEVFRLLVKKVYDLEFGMDKV